MKLSNFTNSECLLSKSYGAIQENKQKFLYDIFPLFFLHYLSTRKCSN